MADTYFTRTPGSAGNRRTFTWSAWLKRSGLGSTNRMWSAGTSIPTNNDNLSSFIFNSDDTMTFFGENGGSQSFQVKTSQVFRDTSAWYHIVLAVDTTQATASNRVKFYVNGSQVTDFSTATYMSQNYDTFFNATNLHVIGYSATAATFNGYMAHVHFTDGTAYDASAFGETDTNGQWAPIPSPSVTYGTNGFFLKFANSGSLGTDSSGNGNDFTKSGSGDQVTDTPDNVFATMNPLAVTTAGTATFSEGNCQVATVVSGSMGGYCNINFPSSGKWYCESKITTSGPSNAYIGVVEYSATDSNSFTNGDSTFYYGNGDKYVNGSTSSYGSAWSQNDIIGMAVNADDNQITFYLNGVSQGVLSETIEGKTWNAGDTSGSVSHTFQWNFGNPIYTITSGNTDDNGYGNFEYAPPSGYLALCTQNLATELSPTIDDGSAYFHTQLYTGNNNTGQSITNDANAGDFQPDFLWLKDRSDVFNHYLTDSSRGNTKYFNSNSTTADFTSSNFITSFDSDGFTTGTDNAVNNSTDQYVVWQWKANGGTTSSNTDGSITSTVQANTTAGFSIVTFTGTGANGTFGHGLGAVPKFIMFKNRTDTSHWICYHEALGNTTGVYLNLTNANAGTSSAFFNNTTPTSSVVSVGVMNEGNGSGDNIIAYCFAEIEGYSKFGSYIGNGATPGPFIYTGFRPAWVMIKRTNTTGNWEMHDNKRPAYNATDFLLANSINAENTGADAIDFYSNGFKCNTGSRDDTNASGSTYIYMAFAEHPFVDSTGRPVTAR